MPASAAQVARAVIDRYNDRDWEAFASFYANDTELVYPQSGERFVGRENVHRMVTAFPDPPRFEVRSVREGPGFALVEADVDYGGGAIWDAVVVYEVDGGSITREFAYFAAPFDGAEWRAPFRSEP